MAARDELPFSWQSGAGQAVRLLDELRLEPGVVLDLGCGYGAVAETLAERGFTYVGCDRDQEQPLSDQRFPRDHPALADATPLGQHLRHLRGLADDSATILEHVRAYL